MDPEEFLDALTGHCTIRVQDALRGLPSLQLEVMARRYSMRMYRMLEEKAAEIGIDPEQVNDFHIVRIADQMASTARDETEAGRPAHTAMLRKRNQERCDEDDLGPMFCIYCGTWDTDEFATALIADLVYTVRGPEF